MNPLDFSQLRNGRPDCPSDLALDRLVAGELDAERRAPLETHAAGCTDCAARLARKQQGWDAVEGIDSRRSLAVLRTKLDERPAGSPVTRWLRRLSLVLAPAAALGVAALVLVPRTGPDEDPGAIASQRLKGGLAIHVHRLAAGRTEELDAHATLKRGDRLRFAVDLPAPAFVRLFGFGTDHAAYTVFPGPGADSHRPAGLGQLLPGAVQVDDDPAPERLFLAACEAADLPSQCRPEPGADAGVACPSGCEVATILLTKEP